ncbi:MAG: alpha/beta hydrolase [Actinomycetota bacterium]|nr:alpha/beta hydrolase [Actinomycetota bacterium]
MTRALQLLAAALFLLLVVLGLRRRRRRAPLRLASGPAEGVLTDDGIRLHVEEDGDPDAPVTVVFSHGFTAQLGEFDLQRETLRSRARLVLYDQRGHGRSPLGDPLNATIEQLGRDLAAVIAQRVPTGPVLLVGHSMGGMTLMTFARQHPEVVRSRVIGAFLLATSAEEVVSTGPVGLTVRLLTRLGLLPLWLRSLRLSAPLMDRTRMRGTLAARLFFERYLFGCDDATPEHVRQVQDLLEATPYTTTTAFYPSFVTHDERDSLPVLAPLPVTVLVGECDRLTPTANSVRMAEALGPSARLVVVPGAGHTVNLTRREVVDRELVDLLERARRSSAVA